MPLLPLLAAQHEMLGNKFELLESLGQGSFGEVWKARRLADDTVVALKIPRDQELGKEFLRHEPELMRNFDHPHIVHVYNYHTIGSLFIIEMEYVPGHTLAEMLDGVNRDNPLSYRRILGWTLQILEGLQIVHAAKIFHGDIKPLNVLINPEDQAKLVDFGTSRRLEDVLVWTRGQGTEVYMAPEVVFENKRSLTQSDIYSIGVMLYEMVTGELPYKSPFELTSGRAIKRPREINANVPPKLEAIILRAMERDLQARYANCAEILADVRALLQQMEAGQVAQPPDRVSAAHIPFRPDSSSPLYYLEQAKASLAADDLPAAMRAAEIGVERSSGHPDYMRLLSGIYLRMGYLNKALETYERVLAAYEREFSAPEAVLCDVLERLGELYTKTQRYRQAINTYERLLTVTDNPIYARFRLAVALGMNADYRRAIQLLEQVQHERPGAAVVYSKLGWAYMLNGDMRQALSYFNQALMLDAGDLLSLFELGKYYWIIGDRSRAKGYFERVRQHDRRGEYAERLGEILGEG